MIKYEKKTEHDPDARDEEIVIQAELEQDEVWPEPSLLKQDEPSTPFDSGTKTSEPTKKRKAMLAEQGAVESTPFASSPLKDISQEEAVRLIPLEFKATDRTTSKIVVVEQGGTLAMIQEKTVVDLDNIRNCPGYALFLADLGQSFGLLNVTGDPKYAAVMGRKELESRGELTADGQLFVHSFKKIDANQSTVLYSVFPSQRYADIVAAYKDHEHGFELFNPLGLLQGLLQSMPRGQLHALALRLGAMILLLVGRQSEVMLVRRYSLLGQDDESLAESITALVQDVALLEDSIGMHVNQINWIEALTFDLNVRCQRPEMPLDPWPVTRLTWDGREVWSALPALADRIPVAASVGPKEERYLKPLDAAINWLLAAGVLLTLTFGAGYYLYSSALDQLKAGVSAVEAAYHEELSELQAMTIALDYLDPDAFLHIAKAVEQAVLAPTMGELWNVLAATRPPALQVRSVELRYDQDKVIVSLEGSLHESISRAQPAFSAYIAKLEQKGFVLQDHSLNIDLEQSDYLLQLSWPIKREL
jgi:hypothetical protein